jgi:hypothetical protein
MQTFAASKLAESFEVDRCRHPTEDTMMPNIIRLAVAVATLALLSSMPAAGQASKLSSQQLNSPTLNVNKPIAAPKVYSPNGNKLIAAPTASSTSAFQRPVTNRDMKPRDYSGRNFNGPPVLARTYPTSGQGCLNVNGC